VQFGISCIEGFTVATCLTQCGAHAGGAVAKNTNEACLLVERETDGLTNPEGGIRRELESATPVELVDCVLKTKVALLDEVE